MTKENISHSKLPKGEAGHKKSSEKKNNIQSRKLHAISRIFPKNKKSAAKAIIIMLIIFAIGGAIPFPYAYAKTVTVPFTTDNRQSNELELNDSKVIQQGINGAKVVQVSSLQSLWGRIFGLQPIHQKETTSTVSKPPTNKVVVEGTRKYQYMLCSDGSYRYYTDEQFKDPQTGFTSKSKDNCKHNNQGHKVSLTNSNPANNVTSSASRPTSTTQPYSYEAEKIDREVAKLNWCTQEESKIGDEYMGKVHQAQAIPDITNEDFNAIVDPAYFKYSGNIGLLRASGCSITNPYPNFVRQ